MAKIIEHLPRYYSKSQVVKDLTELYDIENELILDLIFYTMNQFFVETATYSLSRYEEEYGLPINRDIPINERRSRIISKMRGYGTTTVQKVKDIIKSWANCEVDVVESSTHESLSFSTHAELSLKTHAELGGNDYTIKIFFTDSVGIPSNMEDVKQAIAEVIPAHLDVIYVFKFNTHKDISSKTHAELSAYTHEQIRNKKIGGGLNA
ncbi:MAG: putative phage tail protein [Cetobacterium sp.]